MEIITDSMSVLWFSVDDEPGPDSLPARVERNVINWVRPEEPPGRGHQELVGSTAPTIGDGFDE